MELQVRIGEAARRLGGVTPHWLRILEWEGRIPPARRRGAGRVYTESDLAVLKRIGVGSGERLKSLEALMEWPELDE